MQNLNSWGSWWDDQEVPPPDYSAHVRAAKATLHDRHVYERNEIRLDEKFKKMGFVRVRPRMAKAEDLIVQPLCAHITNLPIFARMTP